MLRLRPTQLGVRHSRHVFGLASLFKSTPTNTVNKPILLQDDLFHPLSKSPFKEVRAKGERIKAAAYCPVSLEKYGERVHVKFECPDCGYPTHATQERWAEDVERGRYWPRLREANEDEHDLRSGRELTEFTFPGEQATEEAVSMANWDIFLYTRGFPSIETERSRRHVSKILTFPMTIGTVLHENSPYTLRSHRLLPEGLRSLLALRQNLHPKTTKKERALQPPMPIRIFVLGARAESSLSPQVFQQLGHLFPDIPLHIYMIGPESDAPEKTGEKIIRLSAEDSPFAAPTWTKYSGQTITITGIKAKYEDVHPLLGPFDPFYDVFFAFSPGFGFPNEQDPTITQLETSWKEGVAGILETKCALFCTGFSPADVERDIVALDKCEGLKDEFDWLLTPGENAFASEKWEVAEFDPRVAVKANWGLYGIRGKRYDVKHEGSTEE